MQVITRCRMGTFEQEVGIGKMADGKNGTRAPSDGHQMLRLAASNVAIPAPPDLRRFELPPAFARLRTYWAGLRQGDALPRRADIVPRDIADLLDTTLLVERVAPGVVRARIAGTRLADVMGMDLRGMPLTALMVASDREAFSDELEAVFTRPAQCELWLRSEWGIGRPALDMRMIFLPVLGDSGRVDRALGHAILTGDVGRAPRRFGLRGTAAMPIVTTTRPIPLAGARCPDEAHFHGFAEIAPPPPPRQTGRTRSYLRVVADSGVLSSDRPGGNA